MKNPGLQLSLAVSKCQPRNLKVRSHHERNQKISHDS